MQLEVIKHSFSVCKIDAVAGSDLNGDFIFLAKTDEELSMICPADRVPLWTLAREDGWRAFRMQGELDFSLVGIIAKLSKVLADNEIPISVVSTFNTDYVFMKEETFEKALLKLEEAGYTIITLEEEES